MEKKDCPICSLDSSEIISRKKNGPDESFYECSRCGKFVITRSAEALVKNFDILKLSAWIREQDEFQRDPPDINSATIKTITENLPNYSPSEKQLILLKSIERRTKYPSQMIDINPNYDQPLCWANDLKELMFYFKALLKRELIEVFGVESLKTEFPFKVMITSKGWDYLEEKKMNPAAKNQAFVAMSFSTDLNKIWTDGIKPAVERAGYKAYRMDKEPHNERIDAKIIAEIQDSKFLIADVTGQKQGVYYEAGFAQGLKLPVLWCVKKDELGKVHFDTRQFSHIEWENADDLKENLFNLICATVGRMTVKKKD